MTEVVDFSEKLQMFVKEPSLRDQIHEHSREPVTAQFESLATVIFFRLMINSKIGSEQDHVCAKRQQCFSVSSIC